MTFSEGDPCPACGSTDWSPDYDFNGEDERRVDTCDRCGWPPSMPMTPQEHFDRWQAELKV